MIPIPKMEPDHLAELLHVVECLPVLPALVRYHDDFSDRVHTITDPEQCSIFTLRIDGCEEHLEFTEFRQCSPVLKRVAIEWLGRLDLHTVVAYWRNLCSYRRDHGLASLVKLICSTPFEARNYWNSHALGRITPSQAWAVRAMLHSLCRLGVGHWTSDHGAIVTALTGPKVDGYRTVRLGDCFLPLDAQAHIVNYIDDQCTTLGRVPLEVTSDVLRETCILIISYQYAFRPGQIARIEVTDVRDFETGAIHIAVIASKQRDGQKRSRMTRKIKREWAPVLREYLRRRKLNEIDLELGVPDRLLFGMRPTSISKTIAELTEQITGDAWSATDLRHSAAQRLADGGVSHLLLTEFLGHSSHRIANVYFDKSPTQAQRINEALAISPIYSKVERIARTRTIGKEELEHMPADNQIGGVPHGIPIAGIGCCSQGQSLCSKNPVLSCYTCSKFMPLGESRIHQDVLAQLRPIVVEFADASRDNRQSPAYAQLKATLDGVRRLVDELQDTEQQSGGLV